VPAREIPSSNSAGKKHVTTNQELVFAQEKAKASRTMSRDLEHLHLLAKELPARRFLNKEVWFGHLDFQLEPEIPEEVGIGNHWFGGGVTTNLAAETPFERGNILDVIDMAVGQQKKFWFDLPGSHPVGCSLGRVEQNPALRRLKQVAVRLENAATERFVPHRDHLK
jgi:hypothetical protein